jgi:hypothetical protein
MKCSLLHACLLTNMLYMYCQNTTVVLYVVNLFISLRYMFWSILGHHQSLWRYIIQDTAFLSLYSYICTINYTAIRDLLYLQAGFWIFCSRLWGGVLLHSCGFLLLLYLCCLCDSLIVGFHVELLLRTTQRKTIYENVKTAYSDHVTFHTD